MVITQFGEQLSQELERIETEITRHESELVELRRLKAAYVVILESRRPEPKYDNSQENPLARSVATLEEEIIHDADADPLSQREEAGYGDLARKLRKFIVRGPGRTRTRLEIVGFAQKLGATPNFPYRFLKRMRDTSELKELARGEYYATPKMVSRVHDEAPKDRAKSWEVVETSEK